ncbi:MAG: 4Fe-4S dicluster domain-containing protein [Trueperaceae bacterium]|nr:MAG: 4Fe-4S dicluster domain-containing protein [Trueperaceae bacterium]
MAKVTISIDGVEVKAEQGTTVMAAAASVGVKIPGLCQYDGLSTHGACRLCMVQLNGTPKPKPACATPITEGMEVHTTTPRLQEHRKVLLEMLFAEGQHVCAVCVASGACELQTLAADVGVDHVSFNPPATRQTLDLSHPYLGYDPTRCILCTRCVRACGEVEGAFTWGLAGRGREVHLITDLGTPWGESTTCTGCGKCISVCPTGAMFSRGTSVAERRPRRDLVPTLTARRDLEAARKEPS